MCVLSLVARFGLSICYERPNQKNYFHIVKELAKHYPEITLTEEELLAEARKWELSHGGMSGRAAQQLMNDLCARSTVEKTLKRMKKAIGQAIAMDGSLFMLIQRFKL